MTIDHSAWTFFPGFRTDLPVLFLHIIGRLTAPIMMFCIVEGYYHTRNIKKYIIRLFILAFFSHFAYALLLTPGKMAMLQNNTNFFYRFVPFKTGIFDQTSVIWAYSLGLLALAIDKSKNQKLRNWHKHIIIGMCLIGAFIADWSSPAALSILFMGRTYGSIKKQIFWLVFFITMYAIVYIIFLNVIYGIIQLLVILAIPVLLLYNGQKGKIKWMKWFFYIYYPLHLTILGLIGRSYC